MRNNQCEKETELPQRFINYMCFYVELTILHQETATQQSAERIELGKFLARVSHFRRHR